MKKPSPVVRFLASSAGRWTRIVAGLVIVIVALAAGEGGWKALALIGLIPIAAGAADFCLLGPLMKRPLRGPALRRSMDEPAHAPLLPDRHRLHA